MKVTKREFRIAAAASLFGFLFCYFLAGEPTPPRGAWKMTVIYDLPLPPATPKEMPGEFRLQLDRTNRQSPRLFPAFGVKARPELLGHPPRPRVDLTSSRHKAEVDLRDLQ